MEYKLQLLSPSPARFARLVTQLKWRLLEGGGQAYYELGVADSGALVGLPRVYLEQSLETLEMMAGEIGASVIVVKEIEVPAIISGLAGAGTDQWKGEGRKKAAALLHSTSESDSTTTTTEAGTDGLSTDTTDFEDDLATDSYCTSLFHHRTYPTKPMALEHSLSLCPIGPESDLDADTESVSVRSTFSVDLEIASVFKPRPMRKRVYYTHSGNTLVAPSASQLKLSKHGAKPKKHQRQQHPRSSPEATVRPAVTANQEHHPPHTQNAVGQRRQARDRRRDEKRMTLLAYAGYDQARVAVVAPAQDDVPAQKIDNIPPETVIDSELVSGLESLHVPVAPASPLIPTDIIPDIQLERVPNPEEDDDDDADVFVHRSISTSDSTPGVMSSNDTRLVVEALVVRKLSLEESFLDFGSFSLM